MHGFGSAPNVDELLRDTLDVAAAAKARTASRGEAIGLRVLPAENATNSDPTREDRSSATNSRFGRPQWRQRLVDAERGLAHALRSESTLIGYVVVIATLGLAATVLRLPASSLIILAFAASQAVIVELIRIAIRELAPIGSKASNVATAASFMAAALAALTTAILLGQQLVDVTSAK